MTVPPQTSSLLATYRNGRLSRAHVERLAAELSMRNSDVDSVLGSTDSRRPYLNVGKPYSDCLRIVHAICKSSPGKQAATTANLADRWRHCLDIKKSLPQYIQKPGIGYSGHCALILRNVFLHEGQMILQQVTRQNSTIGPCEKDALSDVASVIVELEFLEQRALSHHFLAAWLEHSGDFDALGVLRPYVAREALVFAEQQLASPAPLEHLGICDSDSGVGRALAIANDYVEKDCAGAMMITHGFSGSGKTTLATALAGPVGAIVIRNDAETSRMKTNRTVSAGNPESRQGTLIDRLESLAAQAISAGWPVIVESCFLNGVNRRRFRAKAAELGVPYCILECSAPLAIVRERLNKRRALGSLFYGEDATVEKVEQKLQAQIGRLDRLDQEDLTTTITVDTGREVDHQQLAKRILELCGREKSLNEARDEQLTQRASCPGPV